MSFRHSLYSTLLIAASLSAKPSDKAIITAGDLEPHMARFMKRLDLVRKRKMKLPDLRDTYAREAEERVPAKDSAMRRFMYGFVLKEVVALPDEARVEVQTALEIWSKFPAALVLLADIYLALQPPAFKQAARACEAALRFDRQYGKALNLRARIYALQGDLEGAKRLYRRSFSVEATLHACLGLADVYARLYRREFEKEKKKAYRDNAARLAMALVDLEPENGIAHLVRGQLLFRIGLVKKAIEALEESCKASIAGQYRTRCLRFLQSIYGRSRNIEAMTPVLERLLKTEELKPEDREALKRQLAQLGEKGGLAFLIWEIEGAITVLENDGVPASDREIALRALLGMYSRPAFMKEPGLAEIRKAVRNAAFRALVDGPPELATVMLKFLRTTVKNPQLIRIIVHFVYPNVEEKVTDEVRVEAVRSLSEVCGMSALISVYHSLKDDAGRVAREADRVLSSLCDARSPVGGGIAPLNRKQRRRARKHWRAYFHGEAGTERLVECLDELRKHVDMEPKFNRSNQTNPVADHVVNAVLLDNDIRWAAWAKAHAFIVEYLRKPFRPVEQRGKPVTPAQRAAVVEALTDYWHGAADNSLDEEKVGSEK